MSERNADAIDPAGLRYDVRAEEDAAVVVLDGDIDLANTSDIEHGVERILEANAVSRLVLDLADVDFMDSTGLRMLWEIRQKAQDVSAKLVLRTPSDPVLRLLRLTGMHRIFQIEELN